MIYPAIDLARGWLSVGHASSKDRDVPALNRTLSLEQFPAGLRITATDSYIILTTFVPAVDYDHLDEPGADEAPVTSAVAIDADGRGAGFMTYLTKLAVDYHKTGGEMPHVKVRLNVKNLSVGSMGGPQLPGLAPLMVTLEAADIERVDLPVYDGKYPGWQGIVAAATAKAEAAKRVALHPERVAAMAKVAKVHGDALIGWTFCGEDRPARVEILDSAPYVHGAVMPVRWDLWRNAPRVDNPEDPENAAAPDGEGGKVTATLNGVPVNVDDFDLSTASGHLTAGGDDPAA